MKRSLHLGFILILLCCGCIEDKAGKTIYLEREQKLEMREEPDQVLSQREVNISLGRQSGIVEIELIPLEKVTATWLYDRSSEHEALIPGHNNMLKNKCTVDHYHFDSFVRTAAYLENLQPSSLKIYIDDQAQDYGQHLQWLEVNDAIILRINQDHFKGQKLTLENKTINSVSRIKNDTRRCHGFPVLSQISKYSGDIIQRKEYYTFKYTLL